MTCRRAAARTASEDARAAAAVHTPHPCYTPPGDEPVGRPRLCCREGDGGLVCLLHDQRRHVSLAHRGEGRTRSTHGTHRALNRSIRKGTHPSTNGATGIYAVCFSNTHSAEAEKQVTLIPTISSIAASLASLRSTCTSCLPSCALEGHRQDLRQIPAPTLAFAAIALTTPPSPPPPSRLLPSLPSPSPSPPPHAAGDRQDLGGRGARPHQARQD